MRPVHSSYVLNLCLAFALLGCTDIDDPIFGADTGAPPDFGLPGDGGEYCSDPTADYDGDGISNAIEGCLTARDSDGDKVPDWQDFDSDGDKLQDSMEKGPKSSSSLHREQQPPALPVDREQQPPQVLGSRC